VQRDIDAERCRETPFKTRAKLSKTVQRVEKKAYLRDAFCRTDSYAVQHA
jgi:hypothetical protein